MNVAKITPDERSIPDEKLEYHIFVRINAFNFKVVSVDWAHALNVYRTFGNSVVRMVQVTVTNTELNLAQTMHDWEQVENGRGHFPTQT